MSVFSSIMSKIFSSAEAVAQKAIHPSSQATSTEDGAATSPAPSSTGQSASAATQSVSQAVDVQAVLSSMASAKGGGGNWQSSIVDLLKLLELDSSLAARKELATELNVHAGADGSAEENIALHKAVMQKLAENGGKVPESMRR